MSSVSLHAVSKTYPGGPAGLLPTDLSVAAGERLALLGPSGSGKSTLLRLVAGLETPTTGEVRIADIDVTGIPPHRRGVGLLPQRPALYPHLTVNANLRTGRPAVDPASAIELLRLGSLLDRYPDQLSGGERQRVALGKLVARNPAVWLLDEPFSPLDPMFRDEFRHDLHLLLATINATILFVTHDPIDALALGHRIGVLGEGRLQQLGTAEQLRDRPGNRFVAACLGRLSLVDGTVCDGLPDARRPAGGRGGDFDSGATFVSECGAVVAPIPAGVGGRHGDALTLGIRPDDLTSRPTRPAGPLPPGAVPLDGWAVVHAEPVGGGWSLALARGRTRVRANWPAGPPPAAGTATDWALNADRCVWFDHTGRRIDSTE